MDTLGNLGIGFGVAFTPLNLLVAAVGAFLGTIVGVLPGLGPINGVAMLVPICFAMGLPPETALILLAAVYVGAEYGGRITSILLNVPGEAASVMTTLDGYPLARQGLGAVALSLSAWASFIGSSIAILGIVMLAPLVAQFALAFGPAEYFVLMIFAFCALTSLLGDNPVKGILMAAIGLAISTVGVDSNSGVYRYTFDLPHLADGIDFTVVVIGLFAIAEMLQMLEKLLGGHKVEVTSSGRKIFNLKELAFTWWTTFRSGLMGFVIGVLPGAGASVASAVAYSNEKRLHESKDPDAKFGRGDMRGLVAPEAANNAAATGSFIPMLTLGVPGSGTTAVMMGALTLLMNVPMVRVFASMLAIPGYILVPGILAISFIGVYAISGSVFDLMMMTAIGVVGYFMVKVKMPMAPLVLGVVLGDLMEQNFRRGLSITNGDPVIFVSSTICITLWVLALAVVVVPPALRAYGKRGRRSPAG